MQHGNGLLPYGFRRLLEVELLGYGDHEDEVLAAFALGDEGLEDVVWVLAQLGGDLNPADGRGVVVAVEGMGQPGRCQDAHRVGFLEFLSHGWGLYACLGPRGVFVQERLLKL